MNTRRGLVLHAFLTLAVLVLCSGVASATDGVTLIDQNSFVNGFPLVISQPGSYRLSGNIHGDPKGFGAIQINADNVTLDLNGFNIDAVSAPAIQGHRKDSNRNVEIRNGSISDTTSGIELPYFMHVTVRDLRITTLDRENYAPRDSAIAVGKYSIVHRITTNGIINIDCPGVVTESVSEASQLEIMGRAVSPCVDVNNSYGTARDGR